MNINHCDHGHATIDQVRKLPYGSPEQGGNLIVCYRHFIKEIAARAEQGDNMLPTWNSLKIYKEGE